MEGPDAPENPDGNATHRYHGHHHRHHHKRHLSLHQAAAEARKDLGESIHSEKKRIGTRFRMVKGAVEHPVEFAKDEGRRAQAAIVRDRDAIGNTAHEVHEFFVDNANAAINQEKLPLPMKLLGIFTIVVGAAAIPFIVFVFMNVFKLFEKGTLDHGGLASIIINFVQLGLLTASAVLFIVFGILLLKNQRRFSAYLVGIEAWLVVGGIVCSMMLRGISWYLIIYGVALGMLIVLNTYLDPTLSQERKVQHKLRDMETEKEAKAGTLGYDVGGRGYITLNFYNMFWIYTVCSVLGLIIETVWHFITVGDYQDRAGMLFGPFSPIYGFGALLMTIALNRFHDKPLIVIFLISAVIGGAFEYLTSWFLQLAYGVQAWNYDGMWLNIGGRTCGVMMIAWGALGVFWIKVLLPILMKLINLIPWKWRYWVTAVCFVLTLIDGVMTFESITCWSEREAGDPIDTPIQKFYAEYFPDKFMEERFQTMTLEPDKSISQTHS